ncbi:hypothetical protein OKS80_00785 [Aeromonas veronii]|uniref:hypothetical protein n=1 Tax=Aeromonas veronii TaxID=654 RepID=UPI00226CC297|nr:hypothetical protein [Aeromonas veronii]MCX9111431.1 hypothetical protein [Aeromonas veronii]
MPSEIASQAASTIAPTDELLAISMNKDFGFSFHISPILENIFYLIAIASIIIYAFRFIRGWSFFKRSEIEISEAEIGIGNSKIKLTPNYTDKQVAYKIWIELSTRKIGIPIDFKHDVIEEIYNSWYQFFTITRELMKDIDVRKFNRDDTKNIINISISVLNEGIRPHLTEWQAKYRRWYSIELEREENKTKTPQEIQASYPDYQDLCNDLRRVNLNLLRYRDIMKQVAEK